MKKKLLKFFIIIGALAVLLIIISTTQVQAVLQSNPNTHYKKTAKPSVWMTYFRNMEANGAALGLKETKNSTSMLATSESNNMDSHMMKSTEYGAIAILSASGYGNPKKLQQSIIKSTTGNETGIYFGESDCNGEVVAGGYDVKIFSGVHARYYDAYTTSNTSAKVGDALGTRSTANKGCAGWHSPQQANWVQINYPYFSRGYKGGIFSFSCIQDSASASRGVVVCGEGL